MAPPPDPQDGGSPPSSQEKSRLTEAQRRHLAITLGLLQQQLREVELALTLPVPREGLVIEADDLPLPFRREAAGIIARVHQRVTVLACRFDLPRREGSRHRWVRAVLGILGNDLEDARAEKLRGYGSVDPGLARVLDPEIGELQDDLRALERLLQADGNHVR